jgi:glycosyltransferase involved in cell wall biosynthesis
MAWGPHRQGAAWSAGRRLWRIATRAARRARRVDERVATLSPGGTARGRVLLSYVIDGMLARSPGDIPHTHTHFWETRAMAEAFRDEGYAVDVVHWTRRGPPPRLDYDVYVDVRRNFDRYAALLPGSCLKVAHMDTAHHRVHNGNQLRRLGELRARSGIELQPFKLVEENRAAETADVLCVLGNEFTMQTYAFAGKPVRRVRLSNAFAYDFPERRDFKAGARRFLWLGSEGFVHKGLDLALEAFAGMPAFELIVCGPIEREPAFRAAFRGLLVGRPNIRAEGWVDVAGDRFRRLAESCAAMVFPSCSEGGGGCVLTAMHAGLIPVVSREASVDVDEAYGIVLPRCTVEDIREAVSALAARPPERLEGMARAAWTWVRAHHTRERFALEYRDFVKGLGAMRAARGGGRARG